MAENDEEFDEGAATDVSGSLEGLELADDRGSYALDTRRVLQQILRGPSIDKKRHPHAWGVLLRDEEIVRRYLGNIFLSLVVDRDHGVGFTRQMVALKADSDAVPTVLKRVSLKFIDSALLIFLRKKATQAATNDERPVVDLTEITEHLKAFEKDANTDAAKFERQCEAAVERMERYNLLQALSAKRERFEISPLLKLLFTAEDIQSVTQALLSLVPESQRDSSAGIVSAAEPASSGPDL